MYVSVRRDGEVEPCLVVCAQYLECKPDIYLTAFEAVTQTCEKFNFSRTLGAKKEMARDLVGCGKIRLTYSNVTLKLEEVTK